MEHAALAHIDMTPIPECSITSSSISAKSTVHHQITSKIVAFGGLKSFIERKGYGTLIVQRAIELSTNQFKADICIIGCEQDLVPFYTRIGFVLCATTRQVYRNTEGERRVMPESDKVMVIMARDTEQVRRDFELLKHALEVDVHGLPI